MYPLLLNRSYRCAVVYHVTAPNLYLFSVWEVLDYLLVVIVCFCVLAPIRYLLRRHG